MSKVLLLFISFAGFAQPAIPEQGGYWVHDDANILSPQTKSALEAAFKTERDTTSNQIAILTVPSLEGDDIANYAVKVFEKWKIGEANKDNGVLFLIAPNDKKVRIEVGYGLEGTLTDALSSRIIRNEVAPFFRSRNFDAGVKAGALSIIQAIAGQYKQETSPWLFRFSPFVIFIIITLLFMLLPRRGSVGNGLRNGMGPIMAGFPRSSMGGGSWSGNGGLSGGGSWGGGGLSGGGGASGSW